MREALRVSSIAFAALLAFIAVLSCFSAFGYWLLGPIGGLLGVLAFVFLMLFICALLDVSAKEKEPTQ